MQHSVTWTTCLVQHPAAAAQVSVQDQVLAPLVLRHLECLADQTPSQVQHQVRRQEGFSNQSSLNSNSRPIRFKVWVEVLLVLDSSMVPRGA